MKVAFEGIIMNLKNVMSFVMVSLVAILSACSMGSCPINSDSFKWSQQSINYTVLGESSIVLSYYGSAPFPVVTLSESSGILAFSTLNGNHTDTNKCDFNYGTTCQLTITGGNVGSYVITATSNSGGNIPGIDAKIAPIFNYVADYGYYGPSYGGWGNLWMCAITQESGSIDASTCQVTNGGLDINAIDFSPISMVFVKSSIGNQIAYVLSTSYYGGNNGMFSCSVNSQTGLLENCQDITSNLGFIPSDVYSMGIFNNVIYITDYGNGNVYQCPVNASTAALETCVQPENNAGILNSAKVDGIGFYTNPAGENYALFAGYSGRNIYTCQIESDNSLQDCSIDGNNSFNNLNVGPTGITFGFGKAYVANWSGGGIYICDINQSANLTNCALSPNFTGGKPEQLTLQGNVLFVADGYENQTVWKCEINPLDGIIKSTCVPTPDATYPTGTWYPGQIIFNPYQ